MVAKIVRGGVGSGAKHEMSRLSKFLRGGGGQNFSDKVQIILCEL